MSDNPAVSKQAKSASAEATLMPPVNVFEDAAGITLYADLPGVPKDKLNLQVEADTLTIEGELSLDTPEDMEGYPCRDRPGALPPRIHAVQGTRQ